MSKYRSLLVILILTMVTVTGFAQVDQDELRQNLPPVVFINYEGPYSRIDTREQIRQLGVVLGRQVAARESAMTAEQRSSTTYKFDIGPLNRYFVIHCVSGPEGTKIDADIFGLGVDTGVDHIRNLRWIVQGFLQEAYDYSERDAALLAEYITIYNAVYRGNWDYFVDRYKSQVMSNLIRDRAGLSIRYDEWPGRTMMLIPLGHGGLSSIDTSTISDRRVVEELRREDDQGIPQRQGMVDLKEREAEQAEQQARTQREQARQEERRVVEDRRQAEQERQRIEEERRQLEEEQQAGTITEEEAAEREEELAQREEELEETEEEIARREEELRQQQEEAERLEQFAEQKQEEAQQERQDIARDQQAVIVNETVGGVFGISIERDSPTYIGRISRLNPANGSEMRRSPVNTLHTRTITFVGGRIIAIAGENTGNGAVRLVEINQANLEMARQGEDDIMMGSLIWVNGSDLYAITTNLDTGECFIGRFDTALTLQAKSTVKVHPGASVSVQQGQLLTQRENGRALILNPMDLTENLN